MELMTCQHIDKSEHQGREVLLFSTSITRIPQSSLSQKALIILQIYVCTGYFESLMGEFVIWLMSSYNNLIILATDSSFSTLIG